MKISKAVIPVAGLGTRMLPSYKRSSKKELMPILDKPLIQHVKPTRRPASSGIKEIIFVTRPGKESSKKIFQVSNRRIRKLFNKKEIDY